MAKNLRTSLKQSIRASSKAGVTGGGIFSLAPLDLRFALLKTLDPRVTFTRASTGTYVGSDGLIKSATTNEARFDHNPTTGESLGLLVEEARTNLLLRSEELTDAVWTLFGTASRTANATVAPDGATTADSVTLPTSSGIFQFVSGLANTTYTFSVWIRCNTTQSVRLVINTNLADPALLTVTATSSWQRFSLSKTTSVGTLTVTSQVDTGGGNTFFFWGAQLEAGAFPTSYIPTTSATATRAADVASVTGANFSSWYNQTAGTIYNEYLERAPNIQHVVYQISDSTNNERIVLTVNSSNVLDIGVISTGADTFVGNAPTVTAQSYKVGFGYKSDNSGVSINGSAITIDSAVILPTLSQLNIGARLGTAQFLNSTIKRLTYWPVRLANTTLQAITQ